jgi:hypothetical protein
MSDPKQVLNAAQTILLIDWPNPGVPRALLDAGFTVFSFCPDRYSAAEVVVDRPDDVVAASIFPPAGEEEKGYLVFRALKHRPPRVDVVNTYRPAEELPGIVTSQVLPLGAKALWLQPPVTSVAARQLAMEYGISFVEGSDIGEIARDFRVARRLSG